MVALSTTLATWAGANGWNGAGPWWLFFPLFWFALVALIVWTVGRRRRWHSGGPDAVAILSARYARGEIETDEYRRRLGELRGK